MKNFQLSAVIPLLGLSFVLACGDDVSVYCSATSSAGACEPPPQPVVQEEEDVEPTPPANEPAYLHAVASRAV